MSVEQQQTTDIEQQIDGMIDALYDQSIQLNQNAGEMQNEIASQLQQINDTTQRMDKTDYEINKATKAVVKLKYTKDMWIAWILCILLIIGIILAWAI